MATARSFVWADPFPLEDQLNDEERMIRDTAAAFAAEKLAPRVRCPREPRGVADRLRFCVPKDLPDRQ